MLLRSSSSSWSCIWVRILSRVVAAQYSASRTLLHFQRDAVFLVASLVSPSGEKAMKFTAAIRSRLRGQRLYFHSHLILLEVARGFEAALRKIIFLLYGVIHADLYCNWKLIFSLLYDVRTKTSFIRGLVVEEKKTRQEVGHPARSASEREKESVCEKRAHQRRRSSGAAAALLSQVGSAWALYEFVDPGSWQLLPAHGKNLLVYGDYGRLACATFNRILFFFFF